MHDLNELPALSLADALHVLSGTHMLLTHLDEAYVFSIDDLTCWVADAGHRVVRSLTVGEIKSRQERWSSAAARED